MGLVLLGERHVVVGVELVGGILHPSDAVPGAVAQLRDVADALQQDLVQELDRVVHIVQDDVDALRTTCLEVFGSEHGATFSPTSRMGLAQTLALLGTMGQDVRLPGGGNCRGFCRAVVGELLCQANADRSYGHWTSLCDVLPLLAEAAPEEFIDALRHGLVGDEPLHQHMFQDAKRGE